MNTYFIVGFRPLSRYIGLYHEMDVDDETKLEFPSPLEVYRFISIDGVTDFKFGETVSVPSRGI